MRFFSALVAVALLAGQGWGEYVYRYNSSDVLQTTYAYTAMETALSACNDGDKLKLTPLQAFPVSDWSSGASYNKSVTIETLAGFTKQVTSIDAANDKLYLDPSGLAVNDHVQVWGKMPTGLTEGSLPNGTSYRVHTVGADYIKLKPISDSSPVDI